MNSFLHILCLLPFLCANLNAQVCDMYPNKSYLLAEYGVKKITRISESPYEKKAIDQIMWLDSSGCPYKTLYRTAYGGKYTYYLNESIGGKEYGLLETKSSFFDKDSNEVITEKKKLYYLSNGNTWKEEVWSRENITGAFLQRTTLYNSRGPDNNDQFIFTTNEKGDTLTKIYSKNDKKGSLYLYLKKEKGEWAEEQKTITVLSEKGSLKQVISWEKGKLKNGSEFEESKEPNGNTAIITKDLKGNYISKTVTTDSRGSYTVYEYKDGKWLMKYQEEMPYADPVDERQPELTDGSDSGKKVQVIKQPEIIKMPVKKIADPAVKKKHTKKYTGKSGEEKLLYQNPETKSTLVLKEVYSVEGFILESDLKRDNKKTIFLYEFW